MAAARQSATPSTRRPPARAGDTRTRILDVAERLVQVRGFNGFSYADVALELSITKASLHHHFPTKARLGEALIARYSERFARSLSEIDSKSIPAPAKLEAYAGLYATVLREGRMCLCGMLAAEHETLPESIRGAVVAFLDDNETWLQRVLEEGREDASLSYQGSARETASTIVSGLEGVMLVARSRSDVGGFQAGAALLLAGVAGSGRRA